MVKEKLLDSIVGHQAGVAAGGNLAIVHANWCKYFLFPDGGPTTTAQRLIEGYAAGIDSAVEWNITRDNAARWR